MNELHSRMQNLFGTGDCPVSVPCLSSFICTLEHFSSLAISVSNLFKYLWGFSLFMGLFFGLCLPMSPFEYLYLPFPSLFPPGCKQWVDWSGVNQGLVSASDTLVTVACLSPAASGAPGQGAAHAGG